MQRRYPHCLRKVRWYCEREGLENDCSSGQVATLNRMQDLVAKEHDRQQQQQLRQRQQRGGEEEEEEQACPPSVSFSFGKAQRFVHTKQQRRIRFESEKVLEQLARAWSESG